MDLDVRVPVGLMLAIMGAMLALYGIAGDRAVYARSLGININAIWGVVLFATGGVLLLLARSAARRARTDKR
jgi:hypothetical protein